MPTFKTFSYNNIVYTYYISQGVPYLGTNENTTSAIARDTTGSLTLPNFINDNGKIYPLEYVSGYALYDVSLSHLIFPKTVKHIGIGCCESMSNVIYIDLSQTQIKIIYSFTFSKCVKLETLLLPLTLERIDLYSFFYVQQLKFLTISHKLTFIDEQFCPKDTCNIETIFYCGSFNNGLKLPDTVTKVIVPRNYQEEKYSDREVSRTASLCVYNVYTCKCQRKMINRLHGEILSLLFISFS